jgi:hypothetical protein
MYLTKTQPLQHYDLLVFSTSVFYPSLIEVRWFWNGQEVEAGVMSIYLLQNGPSRP